MEVDDGGYGEEYAQEEETKELPKAQDAKKYFEQIMTEQIDTTEKPEQKQQVKAKDERSVEQFYADCNFETETKSFSDFMQCQMHRQNKMILPHATVHESNFYFFSRGKEMWSTNQDFRYGLEDQLRI